METIFTIIVVDALICCLLGGVVGSSKNATGTGCILGFLFGPLGVIATFALDQRPMCPQCKGRLNGSAKVCEHCRAELEWLPREFTEGPVVFEPYTTEDARVEREQRALRREARQREAEQAKEESRKQQRQEEIRKQERAEEERRMPLALRSSLYAFKIPCVILLVSLVAVGLIAKHTFHLPSSEDAQTRWMRLHPQPKYSEKEFESPVVDVTKVTDMVKKVTEGELKQTVGPVYSILALRSDKPARKLDRTFSTFEDTVAFCRESTAIYRIYKDASYAGSVVGDEVRLPGVRDQF